MAKKPAAGQTQQKYLVPVVLSTFTILFELSRSGPLNLADLARKTNIAKSTVFRILNTMHHLGYVWRDEEQRRYALSPRLAELSHNLNWGGALQGIALPYMIKLRSQFEETVNLGRLDFDRIVYLEVVESEHPLRLCERKGAWEYAHASALGKAILAFSPSTAIQNLLGAGKLPALTNRTIVKPEEFLKEMHRVRQRGYALDKEESRLQGCCIGAPIFDRDNYPIAGLSISGPNSRFKPAQDKRIAQRLLDAANGISKRLADVQSESRRSAGRPHRERESMRKLAVS